MGRSCLITLWKYWGESGKQRLIMHFFQLQSLWFCNIQAFAWPRFVNSGSQTFWLHNPKNLLKFVNLQIKSHLATPWIYLVNHLKGDP